MLPCFRMIIQLDKLMPTYFLGKNETLLFFCFKACAKVRSKRENQYFANFK